MLNSQEENKMQLRKVKPDEKHLRSALLRDLQEKVRGVKTRSLGSAIEKMRAGYAKGGKVAEGDGKAPEEHVPGDAVEDTGPSDEESTEKLVPGLDPKGDESEGGDDEAAEKDAEDVPEESEEEGDSNESSDESLEGLIRALGRKSR